MSTEVEKKTEETKFQKLMKVPEFRMIIYVVPVAAIVTVLALLLGR
jgi:hypothetical protein